MVSPLNPSSINLTSNTASVFIRGPITSAGDVNIFASYAVYLESGLNLNSDNDITMDSIFYFNTDGTNIQINADGDININTESAYIDGNNHADIFNMYAGGDINLNTTAYSYFEHSCLTADNDINIVSGYRIWTYLNSTF